MKKIAVNEKYSIFDRVTFELPNWTGYNPELLDQVVEHGNSLLTENESLRSELAKKKYYARPSYREIAKLITATATVVFFSLLIIWVFSALVVGDKAAYARSVGYRAGQIDVLTEENIAYEHTIHGYKLKESLKGKDRYITYEGKTYHMYYRE